jgi:hypothetical protein
MASKIGFIQNKDLGRYLQSLDSVRFIESDPLACRVQAKLEVFTSLMLGRTIPIGEHQFIDSYGLLSNAYHLLKALEDEVPKTDQSAIRHIFPFQLFFRSEYKNIDGLIATKLGDPAYKLSLWHSLSESDNEKMVGYRTAIRQKIEENSFKYEEDDLVPTNDYEAAQMLHKVRDHFMRGERGEISTLYGANLTGYAPYLGLMKDGVDKICSWSVKDLNRQLRLQKRLADSGLYGTELLDPDVKNQALELIRALIKLRKAGLNISNRSHIRIGSLKVNKRGKEETKKPIEIVDNEHKFEGILEIFDSLYNSSIAKACLSHSESVSTARSVHENQYVQAAIALSTMAKNEITDQAELEGEYFNPSWIQDLSFDLGASSKASRLLDSMPWKHVWEAFLDSNWRNSVSNLNQVLLQWDNIINNPSTSEQKYMDITYELDDAYNKHLENVSRIVAQSGWSFVKERKTNRLVIKFLPWAAGVSARGAAKLFLGNVGLDAFWEETLAESAAAAVGGAIHKIIEPVGRWVTKGYIRKTFARLVKPVT